LSSRIPISIPRLHPAQATIKTQARRFNALRCGRRFGKDVLLQDVLIEPAIRQGARVGWFAPIYDDLMDNWRDVVHVLQPIIKSANASEHRIELITGGVIDMWSLHDRDSGRGRKYKRVVINEASKVKDLQYSWEYVIRATLMDFGGDAWIGGTPKGFNYFAALCNQWAEREDGRAHHYTSYDNPHIPRQEIEDMRIGPGAIPDRVFRQEILAEFIADGSFFQNLDQCAIIESRSTPDLHNGHYICGGVDWAKSNDFTVITVGCRECNQIVDWERFNQIDYRMQRARLVAMHNKWNVEHWKVESNSIGEPNIEELQYSGLPIIGFQTTATTKPPLIDALNLAFVQDGFKVPKEFGDEYRAYEIISNSGRTRFGAPAGMHDDTVISTALCHSMMVGHKAIAFGG
jgi:hypothetical protein